MKTSKRTVFLAGLLFFNLANAQTNYPPAPPIAPDVVKAEYYVDIDPGIGQANPIAINRAKDIAGKSVDVSLAGLDKGTHFLYLRTQDASGRWSHLAHKLFINFKVPDYDIPGAKHPLVEAEYYFDVDPGYGNAIPISLNNSGEISGQGIAADLPALSQGLHVFHLRTKDASGKWSLNAAKLFNYTDIFPYPQAPAPAIYVRAAEAFIDTDPGFGNGVPVMITPGGDINNVSLGLPLTGLSQGIHHLFVRSIERPWSLTAVKEFLYGSIVPLTWLHFKGEIKQDAALLDWATAAEVNTAFFEVQHSTDALQFVSIGRVTAQLLPGQQYYNYKHLTPAPGFNFYKIKQVDNDGRSTHSVVIQLFLKTDASEVILAPNPVFNEAYIIRNDKAFVRGYSVVNASGQVVVSEKFNSIKESAWLPKLQQLKKGSYTILVEYKDHKKLIPFIKK